MSEGAAEIGTALDTLMRARAELALGVERQGAWHALCQLEARERAGEALDAVSSAELRARLEQRLDEAVPGWRRLAALDAAVAALRAAGVGPPSPQSVPPAPSREPATPPPVAAAPHPMPSPAGAPAIPAPVSAPAAPTPLAAGLDIAAAPRNRTLDAALAAIHAIGNAGVPVPPAADLPVTAPPQPDRDAEGTTARSVLERIRSVGPPARPPSTEAANPLAAGRDAARPPPSGLPPALPRSAHPHSPRPASDAPARAGTPPTLPTPRAEPAARDSRSPADPPLSLAPSLPPAASPRRLSAAESAARVSAIEAEIERLAGHDAARATIRASGAAGLPETDFSEALWPGREDSGAIMVEEAEVEIVAAPVATGRFEPDPAIAADAAPGLPGSLLRRLAGERTEPALDPDSYAGYHGTVDEASVEIVTPEAAPPEPSPDTSKKR